MQHDIAIQNAETSQLPAIVEIYNQAIKSRFETADLDEFSVDGKRDWFEKHHRDRSLFVAVVNDTVLGWYSLSPYREGRLALQGVKEVSYYVHKDHQQKGIGTILMEHAIHTAKNVRAEHLLAILLEKNVRSINLLKKFGFTQWGYLPDVANFNGERCAHLYYGLRLSLLNAL
jgi:L-amino acid N-acyltransferase YncA